MNDTVRSAIEDQIVMEFHAWYQYLAIAGWFETQSLPGFGHWMRLHAAEETQHAMKLHQFLLDRGVAPRLKAVGEPAHEFSGAVAAFEAALAHEQKVTASINKLYELARENADWPLEVLLQWYITEQVEEEAVVGEALERCRMAEGSRSALLLLDAELGNRVGE